MPPVMVRFGKCVDCSEIQHWPLTARRDSETQCNVCDGVVRLLEDSSGRQPTNSTFSPGKGIVWSELMANPYVPWKKTKHEKT